MATITVGDLQVRFDAETKAFNSKLKKLDRRMDRFGKTSGKATAKASRGFASLKASMSKIGPLVGGLIATLGPAFLLGAIKNAAAFADNIAKTADQLGISTTALQEFDFAATQSGATSGGLQSAIGKLSKALGELQATGLGTLDTLLKDSNVELLELLKNASGVEEGMFLMADAISGTDDALEQAALASGAFGRQGLVLINLLKKGRQGFIDYADQAQELGIILDEDVLRSAEEVTDQFDIISRKMGTTFKKALIDLGPFVTDLADDFADFTEGLGFMISKMRDIENISVRQARQQLDELSNTLSDLLTRQAEIESGGGIFAGARDFLGIPKGGIGTLESLEEQIDSTVESILKLNEVIARKTASPPGGGGGGGDDPDLVDPDAAAKAAKALAAEQAANLKGILADTQALHIARIAAIEPLEAEIAALSFQIAERQELNVAEGEATAAKLANIKLLREEQMALQVELGAARTEEIELTALLEDAVMNVGIQDVARVQAILDALAARKLEAQGVVESADAVADALRSVRELDLEGGDEGGDDEAAGPMFDLGESVSGAFERGALSGLSAAFSGEGVDLAETFGDIFADIFDDAMSAVLEQLSDQLSDLLNKATEGLGDSLGGSLGPALGAGLALGGAILMRELADDQVKVRRASITSAVTSTQQVRGVVAGDQSLPVAQVANSIRDAGVEQLKELRKISASTAETARNTAALVAASGAGLAFDPNASQTLN